jgi:hypothetical protein
MAKPQFDHCGFIIGDAENRFNGAFPSYAAFFA